MSGAIPAHREIKESNMGRARVNGFGRINSSLFQNETRAEVCQPDAKMKDERSDSSPSRNQRIKHGQSKSKWLWADKFQPIAK
jgi:hypothetical protein